MTIVSSRTFRSGDTETIRLPKAVAFGQNIDVTIVRSGDVLTIYPKRTSVAEMFAKLKALPAPDEIGMRDRGIAPERRGL